MKYVEIPRVRAWFTLEAACVVCVVVIVDYFFVHTLTEVDDLYLFATGLIGGLSAYYFDEFYADQRPRDLAIGVILTLLTLALAVNLVFHIISRTAR